MTIGHKNQNVNYSTAGSIQGVAWSVRRAFRMSPTQALFREVKRRGVSLNETDALEVFGGDGTRHTIDYHPLVRSLDVWEIDPGLLTSLRRNLPGARITIADSFSEIQTTRNAYGLIVIDNPAGLYGLQGQHCEHFEIFTPSLFRIAQSSVTIVVNVLPDLARASRAWRAALSTKHLQKRCEFYGTDHPELIPVEEMLTAYRRITASSGFSWRWHFSICRAARSQLQYLVLNVSSE